MIVFIAGATGAVGRPLVEQLVAGGHEVIATTRSAEKLGHLRAAGAAGIVVDARDTDARGPYGPHPPHLSRGGRRSRPSS